MYGHKAMINGYTPIRSLALTVEKWLNRLASFYKFQKKMTLLDTSVFSILKKTLVLKHASLRLRSLVSLLRSLVELLAEEVLSIQGEVLIF